MGKIKEIVYCERCHKPISNINTADYYSHIRIERCEDCGKDHKRELTALRVAAWRERKKQKENYRDKELEALRERTALMQEENELLRERISILREEQERK